MNIADDLNHAYHDGYEAAKRDAIKAISSVDDYLNSWAMYAIDEAISMVKELPSAPVRKTKRGRWIERDGVYGDVYYECSVCGESWVTIEGAPKDNRMNYCPMCGADMREVTE